MSHITRRKAILAKIETEYGIDANPTASEDARLVSDDITYSWDNETLLRNYIRDTMGGTSPLNVQYGQNLQLMAEIKGEGSSLGIAPEIGIWFRIANYTETINAGTSVVYTPNSLFGQEALADSATVHYLLDKMEHKITGCRGNFEIAGAAGQFVTITPNMQGLYTDVVGGNVPPQINKTHKPPRFVDALCKINDYTVVLKSFTINSGNVMSRRMDANASNGVLEYVITDRLPTASFVIDMTEVCCFDVFDLLKRTTEFETSLRIGTASLNRCSLLLQKCCLLDQIAYSQVDGVLVATLSMQLYPTVGDDELIITFD